MDILLYLTKLLETNKAIGIVGLGTLYKKKSPGKYDAEKHSFVPPSYTLAFTSEIKEQEELANFISKERNITLDSANYYIGEFAERINTEIAETQKASLEPLGILSLVDNEIQFIPSQESNVGFEFYGLPAIPEIQKEENISSNADEILLEEIEEENKLEEENPGQETEDEVEEPVILHDEQEVYDEITEISNDTTYHNLNDSPPTPIIKTIAEEKEEVITQPVQEIIVTEEYVEEEEDTRKGMPFFMKFLIAFLILVALGAIVYFVNPQFFNNYFNKNFAGKQNQTVPIIPSDTLNNQVDTVKADSLAKNNDLVKLTVDTAAAIDSSKVNIYDVLVSAVDKDAKANQIIANLANQGIKAKKIRLSKRMINISAGTFLEETAAVKYQDSLRIKLKNPGIYIKVTKPKK